MARVARRLRAIAAPGLTTESAGHELAHRGGVAEQRGKGGGDGLEGALIHFFAHLVVLVPGPCPIDFGQGQKNTKVAELWCFSAGPAPAEGAEKQQQRPRYRSARSVRAAT